MQIYSCRETILPRVSSSKLVNTFMNLLKPSLALTLLCQPCLADLFPNGDFEAGGDEWVDASGGEGSNFSFDYPATGGNPDGHGIINDIAGTGWAIIIGGDQTPLSLASLGLTAERFMTSRRT